MKDNWNRQIDYMRISVTDRCNLRCTYCMPAEGAEWMKEEDVLTFSEILTIARAGAEIGITRLKITGGEPLTRAETPLLIKELKMIPGIQQVTLSTNGVLLGRYLEALLEAGLDSVNVNLPSMDPERYKEITRGDFFTTVLSNIRLAAESGLKVRINCVAREDLTEQDLLGYLALAKEYQVDIRFIEMMPIGYGKGQKVYENDQIRQRLDALTGSLPSESDYRGNGPAVYVEYPGISGKIGFISAISHGFCESCNRVRLTAAGDLKLCLNEAVGVSLKRLAGNGVEAVEEAILQALHKKPRAHLFYEDGDNKELKSMFQIGG